MQLGQHPLQIAISAAMILGAAAVALICDFLKRKNDQLTLELQLRQQKDLQRNHPATPPGKPKIVAAPRKPPAVRQEKRAVNSQAQAVMERGATLAASGKRPRAARPTPAIESRPALKPTEAAPAPCIRKDWGSLLSRNAQIAKAAPASAPLPAGFQDGFVLTQLVQSRQPISGLVVSIGVSSARKSDGALPDAVSKLIQSLVGPNDFAAQRSEDEFLLICPREQGVSAQQRLSQIARQLWDFQLRSLGAIQIQFSWGGVEVRSESIAEAIATANSRMKETKRSRKLLAMQPPVSQENAGQLRQAV